MIDRVMEDVQLAIGFEAIRAKENHGETFASLHEAFGVLSEEMMEAKMEYLEAHSYADMLLHAIHRGGGKNVRHVLSKIGESAARAACEFVQVAAVCEKAMEGMKDDGRESG